MKIRVIHKVFLALFVTAMVAVTVMAVLSQWSLGRGFLDYVNAIEHERIDELSKTLSEQFTARGRSWQFLLEPGQWIRLTGGKPRRDRAGFDRPRRKNKRRDDTMDDTKRSSRPRPPDRRGVRPFETGPRITLFDASRNKVIGRATHFEPGHYHRSVVVDEQTVGWLTLRPIRQLRESRDLNFLEQQSRALVIIALGLLLGAGLLAIYFARHVTRPVHGMMGAVRQMADGNYESRVKEGGSDELAMLSRDINTLAATLAANQQARQQWIADISHELRNPLAIMQGELEAMKDGVRELNHSNIVSLHTEVLQLGKLVNDLHELSLSDLGALSYQMALVDLVDVVEEAVAHFQSRMVDHDLALTFDAPSSSLSSPSQVCISGDRRRLVQLLTNLLENSLRYTDAGGTVQLSVDTRDNSALLRIADSSPGVRQDEYERLFERLYRVETSRTREKGGSGLGLSICASIVEAHSGTIKAQPAQLGGVEITIELPLVNNTETNNIKSS